MTATRQTPREEETTTGSGRFWRAEMDQGAEITIPRLPIEVDSRSSRPPEMESRPAEIAEMD